MQRNGNILHSDTVVVPYKIGVDAAVDDFSRRVVGCIYPKNKVDAATGQAQGVVHILRNEGRCSSICLQNNPWRL